MEPQEEIPTEELEIIQNKIREFELNREREHTYAETVTGNRWIKHTPTEKQKRVLLLSDVPEILWGGAAGGGKSDVLLMAALQFIDVPSYSAILFRKTYANLSKPGSLMDRAKEWLKDSDAKWREQDHIFKFPSGASLAFGYLDAPDDRYNYNSAEFQFIGFDELTEFRMEDYRYLFSRLRRNKEHIQLPLRIRSASNPGGIGGPWVFERFIDATTKIKDALYIPATLEDNPYIDQASYIKSLDNLDPITREQLLRGDWTARHSGSIFRREWFQLKEVPPVNMMQCVRSWDLAATEPKKGEDPDFTAGVKMGRASDGSFWILDVIHCRETPGTVEKIIMHTAQLDGRGVPVIIEREGGASGKFLVDHFLNLLAGWTFYSASSGKSGNKVARATPLACQAEGGRVYVLRRNWTQKLLDEMEGFPLVPHDDLVDACSYALRYITENTGAIGMEGINSHKLVDSWRLFSSSQPVADPRYGKRERMQLGGFRGGRGRGGHRMFG